MNALTDYRAAHEISASFERSDVLAGRDRLSIQPLSTPVARLSPDTLDECHRVTEAAHLGLSLEEYDAYCRDLDEIARAGAQRDTLGWFEVRECQEHAAEPPV